MSWADATFVNMSPVSERTAGSRKFVSGLHFCQQTYLGRSISCGAEVAQSPCYELDGLEWGVGWGVIAHRTRLGQ